MSCGMATDVPNPPQMSGRIPDKTPITLVYQIIPLPVLANVPISSLILHTIQGRSPVRSHPAIDHCAPRAHQQAAGQAAGLEATASGDESEYDPRAGLGRLVVVHPATVG